MPQTSTPRAFVRRVTMAAVPVALAVGAGSALAAAGATDGVASRPEPIAQPAELSATGNQPGAAVPVFLKLDGIPGESGDALHPGEIDVKSFGLGAKNSSVGGAPGKVTFSSVTFTKTYDKSSPLLLQRVATGARIPQATFSFRRSGKRARASSSTASRTSPSAPTSRAATPASHRCSSASHSTSPRSRSRTCRSPVRRSSPRAGT